MTAGKTSENPTTYDRTGFNFVRYVDYTSAPEDKLDIIIIIFMLVVKLTVRIITSPFFLILLAGGVVNVPTYTRVFSPHQNHHIFSCPSGTTEKVTD